MMAKRQIPSRIGDHTDAEDKAAQEGSKRVYHGHSYNECYKKAFFTWYA